jgi:hypothetical protein
VLGCLRMDSVRTGCTAHGRRCKHDVRPFGHARHRARISPTSCTCNSPSVCCLRGCFSPKSFRFHKKAKSIVSIFRYDHSARYDMLLIDRLLGCARSQHAVPLSRRRRRQTHRSVLVAILSLSLFAALSKPQHYCYRQRQMVFALVCATRVVG